MIRLTSLLNEIGIDEQSFPAGKKLRIFDFDDTLVKTTSHIYVTHADGKESKLTPGEYAVYTPKQGDQFDFKDFKQVSAPKEIKHTTDLLRKFVRAEGERTVIILTARAEYKPVKDYLADIGIPKVYVVALADARPESKAKWIEDRIKEGYDDVFFMDDSHKNIDAVKKLKTKYPKVKFKVQQV
jgi:FMN phosphatase YigB (HAD superfamily)